MNKVNAPMHGRRAAAIQHQLQLPHDIHVEILSWLPAKSLLRFRAVCHAWDAACGDSDFALLHLDRQAGRQPRCRLIVEYDSPCHLATRLSLRLVERGCTVESEIGPINFEGHYHKVVGSCNGLLCLLVHLLDGHALYVFNPLLGQVLFSRLPQLISPHRRCQAASYGFGFVPATQEFKVARLVTTSVSAQRLTFLEVCTLPLRSGGRWSWRRAAAELPYRPCRYMPYPTLHAFVNGRLHWLAQEEVGNSTYVVVVSLDLADERMEVVPCPKDVRIQDWAAFVGIAEIHGCLATACHFLRESRLEVWIMREYGKVESWTRLLFRNIIPFGIFKHFILIPHFAVISDGEILMVHHIGDAIVYNLTTQLISQRFSCDLQVLDHVPSLISLKPT